MDETKPQARYAYTPRAFGRNIRLALMDKTLELEDGVESKSIPLASIIAVELAYQPTNMLGRHFTCRLVLKGARKLTIHSRHAVSMGLAQDQSPAYAAFLSKLMPAIAAANPTCRFRAGRSVFAWAILAIASALLGFGLIMLLTRAIREASVLTLIVLVFAAGALVWTMAEMLCRNRPRAFDPRNLPPDLVS